MSKSIIKAVQIVMVGTILFLTGCNAPPAQPTLDPNMIYTAAAQTVQAQLVVASAGTATAAAVQPTAAVTEAPTLLPTVSNQPSDTPSGPVATLSINLTPGVTAAAPGGAIATLPVGIGTIVPTTSIAIATLVPTAVPGAPVPTGDKAQYLQQDPDDGALFNKSTNFDQIWKIQNTGTTTWDTTNYFYADMIASDSIAKKNWYPLQYDVKPKDVYKFIVDMKTPDTSGKYKSSWCLINKANPTRCIAIFDTTINVR